MWDAIRRFLQTAVAVVVAFFTGDLKRQNDQLRSEIKVLGRTAEAVRDNLARPDSERLRDAEQRALYRVYDESSVDKQG
jgi:hypothetical protein